MSDLVDKLRRLANVHAAAAIPYEKNSYLMKELVSKSTLSVAADEIDRLTAELAAHRKYLESITDNGSDYPETMDELIDLGLVVEAPPTQDFIDEWGDDCEMYVLAWSPLARRALDGEEVG